MSATKVSKKVLHGEWYDAVSDAYKAGLAAAEAAVPTPMYVGTPRNPMASLLGGDDGGFDPAEPVYFVSEGACGFAWVSVKGNRSFQNYLTGKVKSPYPAAGALRHERDWRADSVVSPPDADSYYGGTRVWVGGFGQSMARKEAFGSAFAKVLCERVEGCSAYCMSRMD